ncbi:hypothetical protein [Actinomadura rugatobispora]|uniref:Lipoprotein n=1 Tax=Actinomadura rugatobispora TaxID=1994 RepID=A0ABW1AJC3_9ACTN|nr:hypothetical protein GCM10010200_034260 [Actinomadura rugatobispora]
MNRGSMLLAVSAAALALTAAGCGGSGDSTTTASGAKPAATVDQGVKHAQCMRDNGLPGYPDPDQGDESTAQNLPDRDSPEFTKALRACQSLEPPEKRAGTPENAELQQKMLKWAQCMRTNGVPNFPDPQNGRVRVKKGTIDGDSPQFEKAVQACRHLEAGSTGKRPGG